MPDNINTEKLIKSSKIAYCTTNLCATIVAQYRTTDTLCGDICHADKYAHLIYIGTFLVVVVKVLSKSVNAQLESVFALVHTHALTCIHTRAYWERIHSAQYTEM